MAGGRDRLRVHWTALVCTASLQSWLILSPGHTSATRTVIYFLKNKTEPISLSLSFGREVGKEGVRREAPRICLRSTLGLGEKTSKIQSIWHPPALGPPALNQVPERTTDGCHRYGGDRHTQNQNKGEPRMKWDFQHGFLSPLELCSGQSAVLLLLQRERATGTHG